MAARRKARNDGLSRGRSWWWWLAVPLLGVAAYAAFDATLRLVMPHEQPVTVAPPQTAAVREPDADAVPARNDAPVAGSAEVARDAVPVADEPSPTPTAARVAAEAPGTDQVKVKSKPPAPKEHLTGEDKRALEQVLERAAGQKNR